MKLKRAFNRRNFIKQFVLVCSSISLLSSCDYISKPNIDELGVLLTKLLRHHPSAAWLGKRYSQTHQDLNSLTANKLIKNILTKIDLRLEDLSDSDLQNIKQLVTTQIREDFANANVVAVDGWLLSQIEADLCALVYKLHVN